MTLAKQQPAPVSVELPTFPRMGGIGESPLKLLGAERLAAPNVQQYLAVRILSFLAEKWFYDVFRSSGQLTVRMESPIMMPRIEDDKFVIEDTKEVVSELRELVAMKPQVEKALAELQQLKDSLAAIQPHVVMIREIDEHTAEEEIVNYLESHGRADTGELVEKLGIDIDLVLRIVQHLKSLGKVERVDSY